MQAWGSVLLALQPQGLLVVFAQQVQGVSPPPGDEICLGGGGGGGGGACQYF